MDTPIYDFARDYAAKNALRLHMPGHKGLGQLGVEALDLTEIAGADSLYEAAGIIAKSEENASKLFGCPTFYSCEGASLAVRAMAALATGQGRSRVIAAARNVHKSFVYAAALLGLEVLWLEGAGESHLSCRLEPAQVARALDAAPKKPAALYVTSPDYLGHMADLAALSKVCHDRGMLLLVDNAHGAYLKFLPKSLHPMDLGADLCCDSAHKTLPVLTGGAYLHIASKHEDFLPEAKGAMALFGSTSPSYLILESLDLANRALAEGFPSQLAQQAERLAALKRRLAAHGFALYGQEPMKLTLCPKAYGYLGTELAQYLEARNMVCEFADPDFLVLMFAPKTPLAALEEALLALPRRRPVKAAPPALPLPPVRMSIRAAMFAPRETVPVSEAVGRILADVQVGCPPAVPIAVCGEELTPAAVESFRYYGIRSVGVVRE